MRPVLANNISLFLEVVDLSRAELFPGRLSHKYFRELHIISLIL